MSGRHHTPAHHQPPPPRSPFRFVPAALVISLAAGLLYLGVQIQKTNERIAKLGVSLSSQQLKVERLDKFADDLRTAGSGTIEGRVQLLEAELDALREEKPPKPAARRKDRPQRAASADAAEDLPAPADSAPKVAQPPKASRSPKAKSPEADAQKWKQSLSATIKRMKKKTGLTKEQSQLLLDALERERTSVENLAQSARPGDSATGQMAQDILAQTDQQVRPQLTAEQLKAYDAMRERWRKEVQRRFEAAK